jgi:uncharacterized protein (TIGR02099 family)
MVRPFKAIAAAILTAALVLTVAAGVITALVQLATPLLGGFRADVERWLESTLRTPVRIEALAVRWRAHGPELVARNVAVLDLTGQPTIELAELTIAAELADVVRDWRLRPSRIGVAGVRLQVLRKTDGSLGIRGIRPAAAVSPVAQDTPDSRGAELLLLLPDRLTVSDAEVVVEDRMRGRPPLTFRDASLTLRNERDRHEISASLQLPDSNRTRLRLAGVLTADPESLGDWRADLYLETLGAELAPLLSHVVPAHYRLEGMRTDLRWWSHWEGGEPQWIEGRSAVTEAAISGMAAGRGLRIERAAGRFVWDRRPDGWVLRVTDFVLERPDTHAEPSEWALAWRHGGADVGPALRVVGDRFALEDIAALLAVRPPGGEAVARLLAAGPGGSLRDFDLQAAQRPSKDWWWSAAGKLDGGSLTGGGALPGIENVALEFAADAGGGRVSLSTRGARLHSSEVFRQPFPIDELSGTLTWRPAADGWRILGSDLRLRNADVGLGSNLRLDLAQDGSATLDLEATLAALPVDRALALLPVGAMDQRLVTWLDYALRGGTITAGTCTLQGPLADFPFDERPTGRFEMALGVRGAALDYAPGWPGLREIDGRLVMRGYVAEIEVDRARIYDSHVVKARARVDAPPGSPVEVKGTIEGPLADPLRLLRESPLSADFGEIAGHLQGTGTARVEIDFAAPFDDAGRHRERFEGAVVFSGNDLTLVGWPLSLQALDGRLGFDLRGLKAKGIQGQILGTPALVDVQTDKSGVTTLTAGLRRLDVRALDELSGKVLSRVRGATAVTARLDVPPLHTKGKLGLRLETDLRGVGIDLPAPIGKATEAGRPLAIELGFPPEGPIAVTARYGTAVELAGQLDAASGRPLRGTLVLGGARPELPKAGRFALRGRLPALDLPGWLAWIDSLPPPAEGAPRRPPLDIEVSTDRLILGDDGLADVRLAVSETGDGWEGEIRAAELEGSFRYPHRIDQGSASLSLERLTLQSDPTRSPGATSATKPASMAVQDPRGYPATAIEVKRLQLNGRDLGTARVTASRVERGLQLRELTIEGPAGRLGGGGEWLMTETGPRTSLNFALDTPDFGHLVVALGFADSIDKGPAKLNGELNWPGPPLDVSRETISGRVDLDMRAGRFLDVDPGVGRVMGLLNIAAIQRRLTLDFSDLFRKGLGFDTVTGHFDLEAGLVRTEDLRIKGPSGTIEITGRTDVVAQEFDQIVTVTPSLGSTLPIAGAVVGGPVVGAAMLVVQGLVGKQVDQIGAVRYSVQGPWSSPDIKVLAGRPLRDLVQEAAQPTAARPATPSGGQPPAPVEERASGEPAPATPPVPPRFEVPGIH